MKISAKVGILAALLAAFTLQTTQAEYGPDGDGGKRREGRGYAGPGGPGGPGGGGPGMMMDGGHLLRWFEKNEDKARELGLSDKQIGEIKNLIYEQEKAAITLRAESQAAQLEVRQLLQADVPDKTAILAAVDKAALAETAIRKEGISRLLQVRELLGPELHAKVKDAIQSRMREFREEQREDRFGDKDEDDRDDKRDNKRGDHGKKKDRGDRD